MLEVVVVVDGDDVQADNIKNNDNNKHVRKNLFLMYIPISIPPNLIYVVILSAGL